MAPFTLTQTLIPCPLFWCSTTPYWWEPRRRRARAGPAALTGDRPLGRASSRFGTEACRGRGRRARGVDERQREAKAERSSGFNSSVVPSSGSLVIRQQCGTEPQLLIARAVLAPPP
eukprot:scaffold31608_cov63-Phaeocystis_antarctica.AAC.4